VKDTDFFNLGAPLLREGRVQNPEELLLTAIKRVEEALPRSQANVANFLVKPPHFRKKYPAEIVYYDTQPEWIEVESLHGKNPQQQAERYLKLL